MKKYNRSLGKNALLSSIKTFAAIVYPLITYPYITRVLEVEDIGRINFSRSVTNYFVLLGAFGISTFAIRNGSRVREDSKKLEDFSSDIFTINCITSLISFLLLVAVTFIPALSYYKEFIIILGIEILMVPIGVEWLFSIVEDFSYITARSIIIQILSLIALFVFVHDTNDALIYAFITVLAKTLSNVFNWIYSKKYVQIHLKRRFNWEVYKKSLFTFFVNSIASTIYLNSDVTMLGLYCSDYVVGIYGVATRVYLLVKQVFNATVAALIPRLSYYSRDSLSEFDELLNKINSLFLLFIIPTTAGLIVFRTQIILIISGSKYLKAESSMAILAMALFFATLGNIYANGVLISKGKEKDVLRGTVISSLVNVSLNLVLLKSFEENGAALTTLISEIIMFSFCYYKSLKLTKSRIQLKQIKDPLVGTILMIAGYYLAQRLLRFGLWMNFIIEFIVCVLTYYSYLILIKNTYCLEITSKIVRRLRTRGV